MYKVKNRRHKPLYKKFIALRTNVQFRRRLYYLKFKKKKWEKLIAFIDRQRNTRKKNFRAYDLDRYYLPKFHNPFKRRYQSVLHNRKRVSFFYGNFLENYLKKQISLIIENKKKILKKYVNLNLSFLSLIEKRLDVILYRSHFVPSVRNAQQLIIHKHIKVNGNIITNKSFTLKQGDIIEINEKVKSLIMTNIRTSFIWPLPPKYLSINYKTFEIILHEKIELQSLSNLFPFFPNIYFLLRYCR
jgi:ribosomal protein S4